MLIRRYTSELVEENEYVDQILYYDEAGGALTPLLQLISNLREQRYDVVIHTQPRPRLALVTWVANIPVRIGTGYRWYSFFYNKKVYEHRKYALKHELEYNLNLLSAIGCSYDGVEIQPTLAVNNDALETMRVLLKKKGVQKGERIVIIHPGSGGSARGWSYGRFGELAHRLGNISSVRVVITGKKEEEELVNNVISTAGTKALPLVEFGSVREFAALAKLSSLFISNSTGPIHLAAAVGTPVIGLYPQLTPQNATRWGPYTTNKTIFSPVNKPVNCKQCRAQRSRICECMESISVDGVFHAAKKYVGGE